MTNSKTPAMKALKALNRWSDVPCYQDEEESDELAKHLDTIRHVLATHDELVKGVLRLASRPPLPLDATLADCYRWSISKAAKLRDYIYSMQPDDEQKAGE